MFLSKYVDTQTSLIQRCGDILHPCWWQPAPLLQSKSTKQGRAQMSNSFSHPSNVRTRLRMALIDSPNIEQLHQWQVNYSLAVPIMPSAHPEDNFCKSCLCQPHKALLGLQRQRTFLQSIHSPFLPTISVWTSCPEWAEWVRMGGRISSLWARRLHVTVQ